MIQHDNDNIDADFSRCRYVLPFSNDAYIQSLGLGNWNEFEMVEESMGAKLKMEFTISNTNKTNKTTWPRGKEQFDITYRC